MRFYRMIGNNIHSLMSKKGITPEHLSERTGFSNNDLQRIFDGRLILSPNDFKAISDALNVKIEDIMSEHESDCFVHCMHDFQDVKNREMILDLMDAYIDVVEMVG